MPRNIVRESIDDLWTKVFMSREIAYSEEPETLKQVVNEDLPRHNITRVSFDLEGEGLRMSPPCLFKPLGLSEVREYRPAEDSIEGSQFVDYATHTNPEYRRDRACGSGLAAQMAYNLVTQWATCTGDKVFQTLGPVVPVRISIPNPFFYLFSGFCPYPSSKGSWTVGGILEPAWENNLPVHPHLIVTTSHHYLGNDDSMLWGELAPLVEAMHSRANQPLVTDEEEMQRLEDEGVRDFPSKSRAFGGERRFPVMMLSFLNNQYGRVFYASMEGKRLVIHQSKLYSFQTRDDATIELFVRFLLSSPSG